jgi:ParB/RepB/Spo0J family partition protein
MAPSHLGALECLPLDRLGRDYRRYRLPDPEAEADMAGSLRRYGQLTPLVVCLREETYQILDGFKRHAAATTLGWKALGARLYEADERAAKAAIYGLNQTGRHTHQWEDAWIVHALVRQDGLTQVEVAELLGRHKSWVCRRLALVEKLADAACDDLRLGLLSATAARALVRLPRGNQTELASSTPWSTCSAPRRPARSRSSSWGSRAGPWSRRARRSAGPSTPGSVAPATGWRGGWPPCWTA